MRQRYNFYSSYPHKFSADPKWLMDIAKYITTAVILTSIFGDIEERWLVYTGGTITIIVVLSWGLFLVKE